MKELFELAHGQPFTVVILLVAIWWMNRTNSELIARLHVERAENLATHGRQMNYILERLKEPSTWRGLLALATALGVKLHPEMQEAILTAGLALIGAVNVFRKEK